MIGTKWMDCKETMPAFRKRVLFRKQDNDCNLIGRCRVKFGQGVVWETDDGKLIPSSSVSHWADLIAIKRTSR